MISGFLITTIILESLSSGNFSFRQFLERRVRRIFPALIVVLMTVFFLDFYFINPYFVGLFMVEYTPLTYFEHLIKK